MIKVVPVQRDYINKVKSAIAYYLEATVDNDKGYYEEVIKDNLKLFFKKLFNVDCEFIVEIRSNENFNVPNVAVIPLLENIKIDGSIVYDLGIKIPKRYLISFGPRAHEIDAEVLTSYLFYTLLSYSVTEINTRIAKCLLNIAVKNNIEYDNKVLNQLGGILYYYFGIKPIYYNPVRNFETNSLLDLFFFIDAELYNIYAKNMNNEVAYGEKILSVDERESTHGERSKYYFMDNAEKYNEELIKNQLKEDKAVCESFYRLIESDQLEATLEKKHAEFGFKHSLRDLLSFSNNFDKTMKFIKENAPNTIFEAFNGPKPMFEDYYTRTTNNAVAEMRYKLDKLIVKAKYVDNEFDRTLFITEAFKFGKNLDYLIEKESVNKEKANYQKYEKSIIDRLQALENMKREVEELRTNVVKQEIKPKKYGVFVEYPAGYDY